MTDIFAASDRLLVRLAANTMVQAMGTAAASAISFFTFVAVTRGLGPDAYGDYTASLAFVAIPVVLVDIGLSTAVVRHITAAPETTERVIRTTVPIRAVLAALVIALVLSAGAVAPFSDQTKIGIMIGSLGVIPLMATGTVYPFFQARLSLQWVVLANVLGRIVTLALTLAALAAGLGFEGVVWANVLGLGAAGAFAVVAAARYTSLRPTFDLPASQRIVAGALGLAVALGLAQVYLRIDAVLLALLREEYEVGIYGAAWKFVEISSFVASGVGVAVLPALSRFVASGDPRLPTMARRAFDVMLGAGVPIAVLLAAFAPEIIELTAGAEFREGATALRILAGYVPMMFVAMLLWNVLIARGADRALLKLAIAALGANVALNLALIPPFGYRGAAAAALASEALALALAALVVARVQGLPPLGYVAVVGPAALLMVVLIAVVPGPAVLVGAVAAAAYVLTLALAPGTGREAVVRLAATLHAGRRA